MNKISLVIALLILGVGLSSCASAAPAQSTFKQNFSLNAVIQANEQYLQEVARVSGGAEVGPTDGFSQRHEEMMIQIDPANVPAFMEAVRDYIEQALLENNARITGNELSGSEHFSFTYNESGLQGTIHIWGVPGEDANYHIIMLITEN